MDIFCGGGDVPVETLRLRSSLTTLIEPFVTWTVSYVCTAPSLTLLTISLGGDGPTAVDTFVFFAALLGLE